MMTRKSTARKSRDMLTDMLAGVRETTAARIRTISDYELTLETQACVEMLAAYDAELKRRHPVLNDPAGNA